MATNGSSSNSPSTTAPTPTATNGTGQPPKSGLVPTNNVITKDGMNVRVRIEPSLTVDDVIRHLCISLKLRDPPASFALRDETDDLVTNDNLRKKVKAKCTLRMVNSPVIEATQIVEKLRSRNAPLKLELTTLRRYIREEQFAEEFLKRGGLYELIEVINNASGNTLAYALTAMQNLMDLDHGWDTLDDNFILRIVRILSSKQSLINVCRPATAILKKLVEASPISSPAPQASSSSRPPAAPPGSVYRYGFEVVYEQMRREETMLAIVMERLGSADTTMALYSMMLINSLMTCATEERWDEFLGEMERLKMRKAVIRLMSSHVIEDLTSCILDFQSNMIRVTFRRKMTMVEPEFEQAHNAALAYVWERSTLEEVPDPDGGPHPLKWRRLGFDSEDITTEFRQVGLLGLDSLKHFVESDPEYWAKVVQEQASRAEERRCPIAKASNEITDLLSEHWQIYAPGYSTATTFQPFFLNFYQVHALALQFFLRMWSESGASRGDFPRIVTLARSQVKTALRGENARLWHEVEKDFLECEYLAVRDRQLKELEQEDDIMSKVPVRNMRAKLYKESFEFVRQQRIHCLMEGAWFMNGMPIGNMVPRDTIRRPTRPWRFMRLDNGHKYLHYIDCNNKFPVRKGIEDLPERLDVSLINEVAVGTCVPFPSFVDSIDLSNGAPSPNSATVLSFSLLNASGIPLADLVATDPSRWADWTDGLNMLRRVGGHAASPETEVFVQALTEIGLKIKLLDLSGERVDIPSGLLAGAPPTNSDFFFSDLYYDTSA